MSMEAPVTQQATGEKRKVISIPTPYIVGGVILLVALLALFTWFVIWAASNHAPTLEALRDIFIIALALESCLFGILLVIMLIMVVRLVNMLEFEIKPILEKTNETVGMVRGTATFVGENVVKPVTKATSYVAGIRAGFRALFGDPRKNLPD
jgi:membrane protein implicated in regulation of membrane protease activity